MSAPLPRARTTGCPSTAETTLEIVLGLVDQPGSTARRIAAEIGTSKSQVNSILYSRRDLFFRIGETPPRWYLHEVVATNVARVAMASRGQEPLYAWQAEALRAWTANGQRGIVEAVTGAGKTRLALGAIGDHLATGGRAAVVVPGIDLAHQWRARLEKHLPGEAIGLMGDGRSDRLIDHDVVVAVVNSAARHDLGLDGHHGLLVGDEVHRYATEQRSQALDPRFQLRLGLTATLERDDMAHYSHLIPYFGSPIFHLDYERARAEQVIAPFRVALVGVEFTAVEQAEYTELTESMSVARRRLIDGHGVPSTPYSAFFGAVNGLSTRGNREEGIAANRYLAMSRKRSRLMAGADGKLASLDALTTSIRNANRSIVFTETVDGATRASERLSSTGVQAQAIHSKLERSARDAVLESFAGGSLDAVVAPRVLDEGIDVPEADLAVVLAASRTRRQMVQRMGRILRPKADGRHARFALVYIQNSAEDPTLGAHEHFVDDMIDAADEVKVFEPDKQHLLNEFLSPR